LLLFSTISYSQGIAVDTTTLSIPQLVQQKLMQNSCSNETNFLYSSHRAIGEFTNTNPGFPISNGIILRNGFAKYTEGIYTGLNESSQNNTNGDSDLQNISNASGQVSPITDVAFLQFDFTPLSSNFSFDFLFASNEYGQYQCSFSDVFAFLLTDLTTGVTTNLAVIPSTTTPITVKNIRNSAYNPSCISSNPELFSRFNVTNVPVSAINMRGETVLLKATSPVIPNRTYRIKLAIGDYNDSNYDSVVFIKGGSFTTTTNLGPDQTICDGESILLNSGLGPEYTFSWTLNGSTIPGQNSSTLSVTQAGTYGVSATNLGCIITDEIIISELQTNSPSNLTLCNTGLATYQYNLTHNNLVTLGLDPAAYSIMYFQSLNDANANGPEIPQSQLTSYTSAGNQTIYIKFKHITNGNAICDNLLSFDLLVNQALTATTPPNLNLCNNDSNIVPVDLTTQNPLILNGQNQAAYNILYFTSQSDAQNNNNPIVDPAAFFITFAQSPMTIWARMSDATSPVCYDIVNFNIIVYPQPPVDEISDVVECSSYTLPPITNGNYYTGPGGTGIMLNAGNVISTIGTYYIFNGPIAPNGCTNETSFNLIFIDDLIFPITGCGEYIVSAAPEGDFYTGPGGTGTLLPSGTVLTTNQTIYYFAEINGVVCRDEMLPITILPVPIVDNPADVVTCNSYILPPLTNGNYYTAPGGTGTPLSAGNVITTSQDVYIYVDNGTCTNENILRIDIVDTSIYQPLTSCGNYTLPDISIGNYYDQPFGGGNIIPAGTEISSSQTVYYYVITTTLPNCTDNLNYQLTILPLPPVDTPANLLECGSYILPLLTNGNYYTGPDGSGVPLYAGNIITNTQPLHVYAVGGGCTNDHEFLIEIRPLPPVDSFTDIFTCTDYTLPPLTNGTYYTAPDGPNGNGTIIPSGTVISSTQTIYLYNEWSDFTSCYNETVFTVEVSGVEVGTFDDVFACDSYMLPALNVGNYFYQPNGLGPVIPFGTVITTSQNIYVYAIVGDRLTCTDEDEFIITISTTPVLTNQPDIEACGSYILPNLTLGNYFSEPNGLGTAYFAGQEILTSLKLYIFVTSPDNVNCSDQDDFFITIYPLKELDIPPVSICVDSVTGALISPAVIYTGINPAIYTVEWYFNGDLVGTGTNYTATQTGNYDLNIIKNTPDVGSDCGYKPATIFVDKSSPAIATVITSTAFENNIDIIVNVTGGLGSYEFQLDGGQFQSNNIFYDVSSGEHNITIHDLKGNCGDIYLSAYVLKYPKFFTPNGDGYQDTWNISDLSSQQPNAVIHIYDRYGKFIKQLSPQGNGWDGTHNGQPLPSTDYWFEVYYKSNNVDNVFKSHFNLKR
jgi:gliding motility-associated-like protein